MFVGEQISIPRVTKIVKEQVSIEKITLDVDSSVIIKYGEQEGECKRL